MSQPPKPSRVTSVKTPGVVSQEPAQEQETDADTLASDTSDVALPPAPAAASGTLPPDLQAIVAAEVAKALAAQRQAGASMPAVQQLPDQRDVDPRTITEVTLTKQGYVIPHGYGAVPQHLRNTNIGV